MAVKTKIRISREFREALTAIEQGSGHVFLTGRAGTGKSTLLQYLRKRSAKNMAVLAPTGVAALNVKGQTIHSFFGFHPEIQKKLVRKAHPDDLDKFSELDTIVIDEISMVRADLLDCVDRALRLNRGRLREPFGGVQMVFIGDLGQLPPVVTREEESRFRSEYRSPYFFSAQVMEEIVLQTIELKKVYRQEDPEFIARLNRLRSGRLGADDLKAWNSRHDPFFDFQDSDDYVVHLTVTNWMAKARNDHELARLPGKETVLAALSEGQLGTRRLPSEEQVKVKVGSRIMFTANDPARRWVNGSLGTVVEIDQDEDDGQPVLLVSMEDGRAEEVRRHKWEVFAYKAGKDGRLEEEVVGRYFQHPIMLAWAVTIHKSQGKTFSQVLVDVGRGAFAHGQMYVALSRCTTFQGIVLLREFNSRDVIVDPAVREFLEIFST